MTPWHKRSSAGSSRPKKAQTLPISPFDSVLGGVRHQLAGPFTMQFFGADRRHQVRMEGVMHRVWHRHRWLKPFFHLLAIARIFFPDVGCDVPASMVVSAQADGVAWRRRFAFARVRRFDATMIYRPGEGVVERVGPGGLIEIPWNVSVKAPDLIVITTGRLTYRGPGFRVRIPAMFQVGVTAVERVVNDRINVDLVLSHRLLGPIFGYDGTFSVRREAVERGARAVLVSPAGLDRYRPWFYAAAVYNAGWGGLVIFAPQVFDRLIGPIGPSGQIFFQALGMMVLVYAPAYWWVARDPAAHRHLVVVALLGKVLGPLGFLFALWQRRLPVAFGVLIVANDLLWWPAFLSFLRDAARLLDGWRSFVAGR